ncbi:7-cyano-7-deazaguanine synthase [bacterium]|nr:7-cyano-7-deazaguanine synthase [bacterium]
MTSKQKAVVLASGGLDSSAALACAVRDYDVQRAIFVNYGQLAFKMEATAVTGLAWHYKIEVSDVKLPFYADICGDLAIIRAQRSTDFAEAAPVDSELLDLAEVWIPNRNAVIVSIGAAIAESLECDVVVAGFNAQEAEAFPDNSREFVSRINRLLEVSTLSDVKLVCPLIDMSKSEVLKTAVELNVPLEYIYSCYLGYEKMCGQCMSCMNLKGALNDLPVSDLKFAKAAAAIKKRFQQ